MKYNSISNVLSLNSDLSLWNIYYKYFKFKWLSLLAIMAVLIYYLMIRNIDNFNYVNAVILVGVTILMLFIVSKWIDKVIRTKYPYTQDKKDRTDYNPLFKIRRRTVLDALQNTKWLENEQNLLQLITYIKERAIVKSYSFPISKGLILLILSSAIFGAILPKLFGFLVNLDCFLYFTQSLLAIIILLVGLVVAIEVALLKGIYEDKIKKQRRLIDILEELHVERFLTNENKELKKKGKGKKKKHKNKLQEEIL